MFKQGPSGGPTQQGQPNYPVSYPNYYNTPVFNNNPSHHARFRASNDQLYPLSYNCQKQHQQPYMNQKQSFVPQTQLQAYTHASRQTALAFDPILRAISQLMKQMTQINSRMDEIQDFVKTKVQPKIDKKGKQVTFTNQLPSQATSNPRNRKASSSHTYNINHIHADEEAVETTLAISSLRSGKDLPDPYKDHLIHQGPIEEETPIIVEHDNDAEEEEEQAKVEPNSDTYKPHVPYPQALNSPKAKITESDDNLIEAFKKVTITISLIDVIKHIPSYAKFPKGICTPHRNPRRIQLSETISSIIMNSLPIKKRDPRAPMITSEIGGMSLY